jgi:predicted dehydrogenase
VVACADLSPNLLKAVSARYGIPRTYPSGAELLAHEKLDAVVASQPYSRHGILVPEICQAGVPIFTEKPIASSLQVGERIVAELEKQKVWLMVGYHKRSDPASEYARKAIADFKQSGELGKLRYLRITMPPGDWLAGGYNDLLPETHNRPEIKDLARDPAPPDLDAKTYREYESFVNYYIHQVNLLRFLLGESYTVSYADPSGVLLVGHSASGIPCTIEMAPYVTTIDWQESALAGFDKGYVKLELPAPLTYNRPGRVEILRDPGGGVTPVVLSPQLPWVHAMRNQALNFIKTVRGEIAAPCLAPEALEDLRIAREYIRLLRGV